MPFFDDILGFVQQGVNRAIEMDAVNKVLQDPTTAGILTHWANLTPTVPGGILISLAQSKVDPTGPLGQWLIKSAVPVVTTGKDWGGHQLSTEDQQATAQLLSDPSRLSMLQQFDLNQQTNIFKHAARHVAGLTSSQLVNTADSGNLPDNSGGIMGEIGSAVGNVTRPVFAGLQAGYEAGESNIRRQVGLGLQEGTDLAHGDIAQAFKEQGQNVVSGGAIGMPAPGLAPHIKPASYTVPTTGANINIGEGVNDPFPQITAVQALQGKSLGQGIFPGGEASQAAVKYQQQAASVNGHALTPGRALASTVFEPGSKPYGLMSGIVDATVAIQADPASAVMSELGAANKARKIFSSTSEEAINDAAAHIADKLNPSNAQSLRQWAGVGQRQGAIAQGAVTTNIKDAIAEKLRDNPGSLQTLVDQGVLTHQDVLSAVAGRNAGLLSGLRNMVSSPNALTWLNGPGSDFVKFAQKSTGLNIYEKAGGKIPASVAWQLGEATTPEAVTQILSDNIAHEVRDVPFGWQHSFNDLRISSHMPNYAVDSLDPEQRVQRAMQELKLGKVPKQEWDNLLRPLALDPTGVKVVDSYTKVGNRIAQSILQKTPGYKDNVDRLLELRKELEVTGVQPAGYGKALDAVKDQQAFARKLTTYFPKTSEEDRQWWVNQTGSTPIVNGLSVGGDPTPIVGPYMTSEFLNRAMPVIGGNGIEGLRDIRRAVSNWAPVYASIAGKPLVGATHLADHITGVFKIGALAKVALPVRFLMDEQARAATAGFDSFFHNPMSYIATALGHKGEADITGEHWADMLGQHQSSYVRAVGQGQNIREELGHTDQILKKGWGTFSRDNPNFEYAWGDRLGAAHIDQTMRRTAQAVVDPADTGGLDTLKEEFANGNLADQKQMLIDANLSWGSANLVNRSQSDAYIDGLVQKLNDLTAGHPDLMNAVAHGNEFASGGASSKLKSLLKSLKNQSIGPEKVVGPIPYEAGRTSGMRRATNAMFSVLMDTPTRTLTRSPIFKQAYFKRVEELLPHMDEETRQLVMDRASQQGIHMTLKEAPNAVGAPLNLEHADTIAKAYGLKTTHDYLYYPGERTSHVDILRNVMPFGGAWKNVITKWTRLTAENPQVIRRVQQGVTDARQSGWWSTDPQTGKEMFTMLPGGIMKHLAGINSPLQAPVSGLNILGQGLPGVGPAVSWPASVMLSQIHGVPAEDMVRNYLLPYGDPDFSGGTLEQLFPGWWDKIRTAGYLAKLPGLAPSGDEERILNNTAKQAYQYLASTGKYDLSDPNVHAQLVKDSMRDARMMYLWRGLAQFAAPAAPSYKEQTQLKDGSMIETYLLAQDYQAMRKAAKGDEYAATQSFVSKYGPERIFSTQPFTLRTPFALPTTAEAAAWKTQHSTFATKYPTLFGYWAPQGGSNDYNAYLEAIKNGSLKTLNVDEWSQLAEARVGNSIFNQARSAMPSSPTAEQRQTLNAVKAAIAQAYPGYDTPLVNYLKPSSATLQQSIEGPEGLRAAIKDPAVKGTPLATAAGLYMGLRDAALAKAKQDGYTTLASDKIAYLSDALFQAGTLIANQYPEFTSMWNFLFQSEVEPKK